MIKDIFYTHISIAISYFPSLSNVDLLTEKSPPAIIGVLLENN